MGIITVLLLILVGAGVVIGLQAIVYEHRQRDEQK